MYAFYGVLPSVRILTAGAAAQVGCRVLRGGLGVGAQCSDRFAGLRLAARRGNEDQVRRQRSRGQEIVYEALCDT